MAIGDPYATLADLRTYLGFAANQTSKDTQLSWALDTASREIESFCGRQFNQATVATPRVYEPENMRTVWVDDFYTTAGLQIAVDQGGTGTFDDIWTSADYELYPYNGVVDGMPGFPYNRVRAVRGLYFPRWSADDKTWAMYLRNGVVQVTAQWGWAAVPSPVHQACLILAAQTFKLAEAPLGITGPDQSMGGVIPVSQSPHAYQKLEKYIFEPILVG